MYMPHIHIYTYIPQLSRRTRHSAKIAACNLQLSFSWPCGLHWLHFVGDALFRRGPYWCLRGCRNPF